MKPPKASLAILGASPRNVTAVRLVQKEMAEAPMLVRLSGIVMLVRLVQLLKAISPILVTLSGIVMLVRLVQFKKANLPMLVTPLALPMPFCHSQ